MAVLFFLYPRLPPVRLVGSDLAHAVPLTTPKAPAPTEHSDTTTPSIMSMGVALITAAVAIFLRGRIRDYALARADNPTRTRYSGPITVVLAHRQRGLVHCWCVRYPPIQPWLTGSECTVLLGL